MTGHELLLVVTRADFSLSLRSLLLLSFSHHKKIIIIVKTHPKYLPVRSSVPQPPQSSARPPLATPRPSSDPLPPLLLLPAAPASSLSTPPLVPPPPKGSNLCSRKPAVLPLLTSHPLSQELEKREGDATERLSLNGEERRRRRRRRRKGRLGRVACRGGGGFVGR